MTEKVKYIGCYTWYDHCRWISLIDWHDGKITVNRKADDRIVDTEYYYRGKIVIQNEYFDISNKLFEILANSIEEKPIKQEVFENPAVSSISTLLFSKDNVIYEVIIDEKNGVYIIRTFESDSSEYDEYPFEIFNYLIKGLDEAGFKEIKTEYVTK